MLTYIKCNLYNYIKYMQNILLNPNLVDKENTPTQFITKKIKRGVKETR